MNYTPRTDNAIEEVDVAFVGHDGLASEPRKYVSVEFARELERENRELRAWKEEALAVEAQLNSHYIANLLGAKLGESCHKVIAERVPALVAENKELREVNEIGSKRLHFVLEQKLDLETQVKELRIQLSKTEKQREEAMAEVIEQARLNGMGSEREAALLGKIARLEKELAQYQSNKSTQ